MGAMDRGNNISTVYLSFSKAFNSISHKRILLKLEVYAIDINTVHWIEILIFYCQQNVCINGTSPSWTHESGNPQGSLLGPVLFIAFINDFKEALESTSFTFADGNKIFKSAYLEDIIAMLQKYITHLTEVAHTGQLPCNVAECKVFHPRRYPLAVPLPQNGYFFHNFKLFTYYVEFLRR